METRLLIAKKDIVKALEALPSRVLRERQIAECLDEHRDFWRLAKSTTVDKFIGFLLEKTKLKKVQLSLPHRAETLYLWGSASEFAIASAAKPGGYICHYSAMHIHELTDQVPETIYANHEQRPLPASASPPTQAAIDAAFRRPQRLTKNICPLGSKRLCLVNGKHTGRLGVETRQDEFGVEYSVTGLERTMIDIAVRPEYAGGIAEVLEAYRRASGRVSVNKLSAMLQKMAFVYPYRQAIGFLLEHSGAYKPTLIEMFRSDHFEFDFYLAYAMKHPQYSERWRLYTPAGL